MSITFPIFSENLAGDGKLDVQMAISPVGAETIGSVDTVFEIVVVDKSIVKAAFEDPDIKKLSII